MELLHDTPALTADTARDLARSLYGLDAQAASLPSERDQNFLIETVTGARFVLKIANGSEPRAMLEAQNAALHHLAARTDLCPSVVPTTDGRTLTEIPSRHIGRAHFVRLLTWLPGATLGSLRRRSPALLEDLGRAVGRLDAALHGFDHPAIHRDFYWDLANGLRIVQERSRLIADETLRLLTERLCGRVQEHDAPRFGDLRGCAVHNDPNDYNVLVVRDATGMPGSERVVGILDFGDMVHSFASSDLAIAIAYGILGSRDPLAGTVAVARGYNEIKPLSDVEVDTLFGLVTLRLCTSMAVAASQQAVRPDDPYLSISQEPIRAILPRLAAIHPRLATAALRAGCGKAPVPSAGRVMTWLEQSQRRAASILDRDLSPATVIDLSVSSRLVSGDPKDNETSALSARIEALMSRLGAGVGIGRYGEARLLYWSPLFTAPEDAPGAHRSVHLGLDLFAPAGTSVRAPLDGVVHAVADNRAPLDYGPVVILGHRTDAGDTFYTLYGHLSRTSAEALSVGQRIDAGAAIAALGTPAENGGWPPHLHFQIILDLLDLSTDFPGVCGASDEAIWRAFSPDPNAILRLPAAAPLERSIDHLEKRRRLLGRNLSIAYRDPIHVVRGWMQYLFDAAGRRYLDAYNNVPHVGHSHPRVVQAAAEQMAVLNTNTRYLHDAVIRYAERLTATLPEPLRVCFFVNSGSEANELALRLARTYTRRRGVVVLEDGYHGNTTTLVDISAYKFNGPGGDGPAPWVRTVPVPDVYRGAFRDNAGEMYAATVAEAVQSLQASPSGVAAYIAESAPSVAGQIILPSGYLSRVYRAVRAAGGVCIADEVQTAFGRLGHSFYAFEAQQVVPDIVVLGKPIGNGHPIGAVITTPEIAASFDNGMEFFSTFGGNTVSCAVGLAVLDVVAGERLQAHAHDVGAGLIDGLRALAGRHALIGDVRGSGLFIGVELVTDRDTLEPATAQAAYITNRMRDEGLLFGTEGRFSNVLKIRPPMPFTVDDGAELCESLGRILGELS
ncbi:MAG TPA: aminotransferase class III-fold pyridoxal phosphate-dependent enzyme [Vicinamibacterales bacterium]